MIPDDMRREAQELRLDALEAEWKALDASFRGEMDVADAYAENAAERCREAAGLEDDAYVSEYAPGAEHYPGNAELDGEDDDEDDPEHLELHLALEAEERRRGSVLDAPW